MVLTKARGWLRDKKYHDLLLIVDGLEKIPQKVINDRGLTNHENLFLDHQNVLRSLNCHVLYTIPIALAYSRCRKQLEVTYGTEVYALPAIPVVHRDGTECPAGIDALCRIVEQRAEAAGGSLNDLFETREVLRCACRISGGHVRSLFMLVRSALERSDQLPIVPTIIEKTFRRQSADIRLGMKPEERELVNKVHDTKQAADENPEAWYGLLRDLYVFGYDYQGDRWYDWNPLLASSSGCQA